MESGKYVRVVEITIIGLLVLIGIIVYVTVTSNLNDWAYNDESPVIVEEMQTTPNGNEATTIPSANPADNAYTSVNPVEKTNPFKDEYQNPFE